MLPKSYKPKISIISMVKVKKRSGKVEGYSKAKLIRALKKAGAKEAEAKEIEKKVHGKIKRSKIASVLTIRKYALKFLRSKNPAAYKRFIKHRKKRR